MRAPFRKENRIQTNWQRGRGEIGRIHQVPAVAAGCEEVGSELAVSVEQQYLDEGRNHSLWAVEESSGGFERMSFEHIGYLQLEVGENVDVGRWKEYDLGRQ